jgi:vesicle coat complex subunit
MILANEENVEPILSELKEYASEVDVDFVRKSVRSIGICAVKIESAAEKCVAVLVDLIQTKVNYVVQEAIVVIKVSIGEMFFMWKKTIKICRISFVSIQIDTKVSLESCVKIWIIWMSRVPRLA